MTTPIVEQPKSRCPNCQSTERTGYTHTERKKILGVHDGKTYNVVIWRRCKCENCGKHRVDKSFENVPENDGRGKTKKEKGEVRGNSQPVKTETPKQNRSQSKLATSKNTGSKKSSPKT